MTHQLMDNINRKFFDAVSERYNRAARSWQGVYDQAEKYINPLIKGKTVLDIGNGGHFAYSVDLPKQVIAMDIAPAMLSKIEDANVVKVVSDAEEMKNIDEESVDIVVFSLSLRYINGIDMRESLDILERILLLVSRKIRTGGYLIIIEEFLPWALFYVQCLLFSFTKFVLNKCGVPMIFSSTLEIFVGKLAQIFQLKKADIKVSPLKLKGLIDPFGGSFPCLIKIPACIHPKYYIIIAAKK